MEKAKSYEIPQQLVVESYKCIKANRGSYGIDKESLSDFEKDWKNNLYKIWNRMSSGSYFPPPVRVVDIPKSGGGVRRLGIPTVADRIAQMVCKLVLEPKAEPLFHNDSYGYRPAAKKIRDEMRSWHITGRMSQTLESMANISTLNLEAG